MKSVWLIASILVRIEHSEASSQTAAKPYHLLSLAAFSLVLSLFCRTGLVFGSLRSPSHLSHGIFQFSCPNYRSLHHLRNGKFHVLKLRRLACTCSYLQGIVATLNGILLIFFGCWLLEGSKSWAFHFVNWFWKCRFALPVRCRISAGFEPQIYGIWKVPLQLLNLHRELAELARCSSSQTRTGIYHLWGHLTTHQKGNPVAPILLIRTKNKFIILNKTLKKVKHLTCHL